MQYVTVTLDKLTYVLTMRQSINFYTTLYKLGSVQPFNAFV